MSQHKFFSKELGLNIVVRKGDEAFLPDDNALVAVTYFEGTGLFEAMADGIRRRGQPLCASAESFITAFAEPETPSAKSRKSTSAIGESYPQNSDEEGENYPQNSAVTVEPSDAEAVNNSETEPKTRSYKSLHRGWKNVRDKVLNSAKPENTAFVSAGFSGKISFDRISKSATAFIPALKRKFPTLEGCGTYFEPDADGLGWHAHLFPHFSGHIPDDFEDFVRAWWAEREDVTTIGNEYQVNFLYPANKEQLVRMLDYVNPTTGKKKGMMCLYPVGRQAARYYGSASKPRTVTAPLRILRELCGKEFLSLRRSTEFTDPSSGEVIYSRTTLVFDVGKTFLERLREHRNADFEGMIFIADECTECQRGAPHGTLRKFCDGCIFNSA